MSIIYSIQYFKKKYKNYSITDKRKSKQIYQYIKTEKMEDVQFKSAIRMDLVKKVSIKKKTKFVFHK